MSADTRSALISAPASTVFAFMSDADRLTLWSFGTWRIERHDGGLIHGHSLMTGAPIWLRIATWPDALMIDYHLGASPDALRPRIFARVIPGTVTGHGEDTSLLTMTGLRTADMDDARWAGLGRAHAFEVDVIRGLIESGHDHRTA